MVTLFKPIIARIRGTEYMDAFEKVGEPIAVKHLCEPGIKSLLGLTLEPLTPTKIEITANVLVTLEKEEDEDSS